MNFIEINKKVKSIREHIKKVRFEEALFELEAFIGELGDKTLDKEIVALTARYHTEAKKGRLGTKNGYENQNLIIYTIAEVLDEAKERAIEKVTLETGAELEKINEKGNEVIKNLEEMTKLTVESRLLEMEMFRNTFNRAFSPEQSARMDDHIKRFNQILGKMSE